MILSDWFILGGACAGIFALLVYHVIDIAPIVNDDPNFDTINDSAYMIDGKITDLTKKDK